MKDLRIRLMTLVAAVTLWASGSAFAEAWSFGVMSDTQWSPSEGHPDKGVPTEIIDDVNQQFIKAGVKFVIQVGDITQNAGKQPDALDELDIRARHNAALAAAGIRYFALRGNHEGSAAASVHFGEVFTNLPGTAGYKAGDGYGGGSSPDLPGLAGRSYSFTYNDASFVLLDQFIVADGSAKGKAYPISQQLPWIAQQLSQAKAAGQHAFVFGHKNLLGQNHKDNLFGEPLNPKTDAGDADPAKQPTQVAFIRALQENGVHLYMSGHDHMYHRAMVSAPDASQFFRVQQIITGSCSYKFYEPSPPYSSNEQPIVQERNAVGYSIVTIDGAKVIYRYYSAPVNVVAGARRGEISKWQTPSAWPLQDEFGYNLNNGKQFLIKKAGSLDVVHDEVAKSGGFVGTKMAIIGGTNDAAGTTLDDQPEDRRNLTANVNTGWSPRPFSACASDELSISGLRSRLGSGQTSVYVLSMSYDAAAAGQPGAPVICSPNAAGEWVNATALNSGGTKSLINGVYKPEYGLGSYGVNTQDHTVWAVLDHEGDFVVSQPPK